MVTISPDLIILGLIAGVILFRLYTTLGKRDDDGIITHGAAFNNIIDISSVAKEEKIEDILFLDKDLAVGFEEVLINIRKLDPNFSLRKFMDGAKKAFEMIILSFADNDRDTLKNLLGNDVYKQFIGEIDKRVKNEVTLNLTLVSLPLVEIKNIQLDRAQVSIDVLYNSQQITLLKNSKGEIIEGNSSQIDNVEDIWTFSKKLNSSESWLLVKVNAS